MIFLDPLKNYADFSGRARRSEYWLWALFQFVVIIVLEMLAFSGGAQSTGPVAMLGLGLLGIFLLGTLVPSLAVAFRRMHDTNRSAWWLLIGLIPFLGALVLFIFTVLDGTPGPNRFGPDPKGRAALNMAETFA